MFNNKKNLLILFVLLALGVVMVLVMKMIVSMETGTILTALLIPLLAYLLLSGAISEFRFREIKVTFNRVSSAEIVLSELGQMTPTAPDFDQVGEKGGAALEEMLRTYKLSEAKPIVLCFKLGRGDYKRKETVDFIRTLSSHRSFKLIVFLGQYNRVIAYMPFWAIMQHLTDEQEGDRLIAFINDNHVQDILELPRIVKEPLSMKSTNTEVLRKMMEVHLDALVVVDGEGSLKGVVERDEVVSKMMLTLVDKSATSP